jgi:hypothetical protein
LTREVGISSPGFVLSFPYLFSALNNNN